MKLFLASNNAHKAAEFAALATATTASAGAAGTARPHQPLNIFSARAAGGMPAVAEDAGTFVGNALLKARALRAVLDAQPETAGAWALADDSGLRVDALGGAPGVESARYAGPGATDAQNLAKLVAALRGVPAEKRGAEFVCVLALIGPDGTERIFEGRCPGRLLNTPRGAAGFGYDPLFVPEGETRTFAEMDAAEKNARSHRARAWAALAAWAGSGPA
jgi:XTP/dITP diphosphohydrolase